MEDTRIRTLYTKGFLGSLARLNPLRSGVSLSIWISVLLLMAGLAIRLRGSGHLTRIERRLGAAPISAPAQPAGTRPGGQDPVVLTRPSMFGGVIPEFVSATLLPGLGMDVLQLTAALPEKGETPLLMAPTLDDLGASENTGPAAARTEADAKLTGAFLIPWSGSLTTQSFYPEGLSQKAYSLQWHGQTITVPAQALDRPGYPAGVGSLLSRLASESVQSSVLPDGGETNAVYTIDGSANPSVWAAGAKTRVKVSAVLSSRSVDLSVEATNIGGVPEPIGIGWLPRFVIPSGLRQQATLHLPAAQRVEMTPQHKPTGRLLPVGGTPYDFTARGGVALGEMSIDQTYTDIRQNGLDAGPLVELRDPASNFGLRITLLSSATRTVRIIAPANAQYISIIPGFNVDDPFGKEWTSDNTGIQMLKPGQTAVWRIRLELFSNSQSAQPQL